MLGALAQGTHPVKNNPPPHKKIDKGKGYLYPGSIPRADSPRGAGKGCAGARRRAALVPANPAWGDGGHSPRILGTPQLAVNQLDT